MLDSGKSEPIHSLIEQIFVKYLLYAELKDFFLWWKIYMLSQVRDLGYFTDVLIMENDYLFL